LKYTYNIGLSGKAGDQATGEEISFCAWIDFTQK